VNQTNHVPKKKNTITLPLWLSKRINKCQYDTYLPLCKL
jgi:hypothetical protein